MTAPAVVRHDGEDGWWEMHSRLPNGSLRGFVRRYLGYRESSTAPVRRREIPTGDVQLILTFGPPIEVMDATGRGNRLHLPASFVATVADSFIQTEYVGDQYGLQVTLTPLGASMLLGVPMHSITAAATDLANILGAEANLLVERLAEAPGWAARFDLMDDFLASHFARGREPSPAAAWAWRELRRTSGTISVQDLVADLGCSHRYLLTEFQRHVGIGPKSLARVLRCQRAIGLLESRVADRTLADIAAACGYADHGHFSRDFRRVTGLSPSRWSADFTLQVPELSD